MNPEIGASLRCLEIDGLPWFVAKDVCQALEIDHTASTLRKLDEDEKGVHSIHTLGGPQKMAVVSESGLYALILRSDKPAAKVFRRWVTGEVLPQIRETGSYSSTAALLETLRRRQEMARSEFLEVSSELVALRKETARRIARELGISREMEITIRGLSGIQTLAEPVPELRKTRRGRGGPKLNYCQLAQAMPGPLTTAEMVDFFMRAGVGRGRNAAFKCMERAVKRGTIRRENGVYFPTSNPLKKNEQEG